MREAVQFQPSFETDTYCNWFILRIKQQQQQWLGG